MQYLHSVSRPLKPPSITNCLVAIIHTKPVMENCVPKLVAMATSLSTNGPPSNTILWAHPSPQPKRHSAMSCAKIAEPIEMPFRLWARVGSMNHVLDESPDPLCKRAIFRGQDMLGMPDNTLPSAMQKWQKKSRCHLGCGLRWAEGSMCYMGAHWRHLANTTEPSMCSGDAALFQITLTTFIVLLQCCFYYC